MNKIQKQRSYDLANFLFRLYPLAILDGISRVLNDAGEPMDFASKKSITFHEFYQNKIVINEDSK